MKELFEKFLMQLCLSGIGMIAVAAFVRYMLPTVSQKVKAAPEAIRRNGVIAAFIAVVFVCGMIVYGSTKNNATSNDPPARTQMIVSPTAAVEALPAHIEGEIVRAGHQAVSPSPVPTNAIGRVEKWWRRGALNDGHIVTFDEDWRFPHGTSHLASIEVWSSGAVYASEKDPTPIAELVAKLSLAPHDTEVFAGRTTNNTYRIEWHSGHPNRDPSQTADASIELFRNGNVIVTESGVSVAIPYSIPFPHDGYGQDEAWVRANYTNADEILSIGYRQWVERQVGVGLANGLYQFSAEFLVDPPEPTELYIGDYSVCVTNAGVYSFVLEKGTEYEFGTWPFNDDVDYWAQDDMASGAPMLRSIWGGGGSPGEWTIDGGEHWLEYPVMSDVGYWPGWCCWLPTLQGSPNVGHLGVGSFPQSFEAILSDFMSDIPTNGCVIMRCINGEDKISLWSSLTNGVSVATSNSWDVAVTNSFSCYVEGIAQSAYEGVEFECTYVPASGSNTVICAKSTVFECHAQPVSNMTRTGLEVINPSFLSPQSNAMFRVEVKPIEIPASKISWRTVAGAASFQSGTNGLETVVLGSSGMVDLEINVLGATDERMHVKSEVIQ